MNTDLSYSERFSNSSKEVRACYKQPYLIKTDIQLHLEKVLLSMPEFKPLCITDLCGGTGHVISHLSRIYDSAQYINVDLNKQALAQCQLQNTHLNIKHINKNCYNTGLPKGISDLTLCWLSLFHLSEPEMLAKEALRLTSKNGMIAIATLINKEHDIDIYSRLVSSPGATNEDLYIRNTYTKKTFEGFFKKHVNQPINIIYTDFKLSSKIKKNSRSVGTYNVDSLGNAIAPISGGLLMPMEVIIIQLIS